MTWDRLALRGDSVDHTVEVFGGVHASRRCGRLVHRLLQSFNTPPSPAGPSEKPGPDPDHPSSWIRSGVSACITPRIAGMGAGLFIVPMECAMLPVRVPGPCRPL